ncbi:MAG TPA: UDP-N-acetylmuramate--L-alanine ligase [Solirubrobacteraceae bacterium]
MSRSNRPWSGRRLHFVGVGGAGMSGYARAAHALGAEVTGSDGAQSPYAERLKADGVLEVKIGHDAGGVPAGEGVEVIYSSAVPAENPEREAARERGLPERPRAELLAEFTTMKRTIAVAGTHGKTTTASMLVHALRAAGLEPGWLVGAPVGSGLANAEWSEGEWLVVEADESDRSMLSLKVEVAVLTNVELDHHASFGSLAELEEAFRAFLRHAEGAIVVWDRPELLALAVAAVVRGGDREEPAVEDARGEDRAPALGGEAGADADGGVEVIPYDVSDPLLEAGGSRFQWHGHEVTLGVPGAHNALNATAALEAARLAGAGASGAIAGLAGFTGAGRRFQRLGETRGGATVYDDYAHHPTEVAATLRAARTLEGDGRLVAVFQPHLFSRTALLTREFGVALALADVVAVLDVYPARERGEDHPGVSGLLIAEAAADAAGGKPVYWLPSFTEAESVLKGVLDDGDVCLVMGAGDVDGLARRLVEVR